MSNFNEYFENTGAELLIKRLLNNIDLYSKVKIIDVKHEIVEEPPQPVSYYVENDLTATFKVKIKYITDDKPEEIKISTFEVPKEIDGTFIIEGAYRFAFNQLSSDYDCRINMAGSGDYIVKFDYGRVYNIKKRTLSIIRPAPERPIIINYEDIDNQTEEFKETYLKLTDYQVKKLQIKLDLDYKPEFINTRIIDECMAFGDDRYKDLIIDKRVENVPAGFMSFIFKCKKGKNYIYLRNQLSNYFLKYKKLPDELNTLSKLCWRFFKGTQDATSKDSRLEISQGINAMNMESMTSKITIPETCAYNTTMSDIIDMACTPINQNTNLQNSITVSTHITDSGILFDVYDKNFKKITIEYIDYLNSKVCASEFVDYEKNEIKPNEKGEVEVKYRMYRKMVKASEIDLIDLHPDYRLSSLTRRIPFINCTDSVRISMGTTMLRQAIPLVNAQRPLVDTGNYEELSDNIYNEKFKYDEGKVIKIDEDKVVIELKDKTEINIKRKTALNSINDVCVYSEPKVKVGQKVKRGDVITGAVDVEKDTYKAGVNALVLFHAMFGLVNEDALVVSESFAERMTHYSIIDLQMNINTSNSLKWIAPIGTKVKSGDDVVKTFKTVRLDEVNRTLNEKLGGLFGEEGVDLTQYTIENSLKVPNNVEEAWISDVKIQEMTKPIISKTVKKPDYTFAHQSQKIIDEYNKDRKVIYDRFPEYIASDTLDPIIMNPKEYKIVYNVRIRLIKKTILMNGSKVTNRFGGKGVISKVLPDEMMPIMVEKGTGKQTRVEVVMNPYSTINRKISGVLYEQNLGLIAHKLYDLVEQYKTTKTNQKKIMPLINEFYPGRYDGMDVEKFIKLHESKPIEEVYYFNVGCFSKIKPEKIEEWMDKLGLESQCDILMPTEQLTDLDELRDNLPEEEYEKVLKSIKGKYTKVDKKLQCGYLTLEELYHIPSYSNKVTTSMFGNDVSFKRDEPIMGKGRYRESGQKIDELNLFGLLSRNVRSYIDAAREDVAKEDNQLFLNNLLGLGLTVSDSKGYNLGGSSIKSDINSMKNKFRLKNK